MNPPNWSSSLVRLPRANRVVASACEDPRRTCAAHECNWSHSRSARHFLVGRVDRKKFRRSLTFPKQLAVPLLFLFRVHQRRFGGSAVRFSVLATHCTILRRIEASYDPELVVSLSLNANTSGNIANIGIKRHHENCAAEWCICFKSISKSSSLKKNEEQVTGWSLFRGRLHCPVAE